jgi:uncharacterized protein YkwD
MDKKFHVLALLTLIITINYSDLVKANSANIKTAKSLPKNTILIAKNTLEQQVLAEINRVRRNPRAYAEELTQLRQYYQGNMVNIPGQYPMQTQEGLTAVDEAIADLRGQNSLPLLSWSDGLAQAARDHVNDIGPKGIIGHDGTDGSNPLSRIQRYGHAQITWSENVSYGINSAKEVVQQLIIDDGVPSRGHRKTIIDANLKLAGVACGSHAKYQTICVIDYAAIFTDKNKNSTEDNILKKAVENAVKRRLENQIRKLLPF